MAEVGLVGCIISLAGVGAKLGIQLYAIADGVGSAGREARLIAAEVSVFSHSLTALSKSLRRPTSESSRLQEIAESLLVSCNAVLDQLSEIVCELAPLRPGSGSSRRTVANLLARLKWMLQKPKVVFIRDSIDSFKSTLILLVMSMDFTEALDRHAPEEIKFVWLIMLEKTIVLTWCRNSLRTQVESLIQTVKQVNSKLVRSYRSVEQPREGPENNNETLFVQATSDLTRANSKPSELLLIDFGDEYVNAEDTPPSSGVLELSSLADSQPNAGKSGDEQLAGSELQRLDLSTDEGSSQALIGSNEILHTQQRVLQLAGDALQRHPYYANWSWNSNDKWSSSNTDRDESSLQAKASQSGSRAVPTELRKSDSVSIDRDSERHPHSPERNSTVKGVWSYVEDADSDEVSSTGDLPDDGSIRPASPTSHGSNYEDPTTTESNEEIDRLERLLKSLLGPGSEEYLRRNHKTGGLTAQQRIKSLEESIHAFMNARTNFGQNSSTPMPGGRTQNAQSIPEYYQPPYGSRPFGDPWFTQAPPQYPAYGSPPYTSSPPPSGGFDYGKMAREAKDGREGNEVENLKALLQKHEEARVAREQAMVKMAEEEAAQQAKAKAQEESDKKWKDSENMIRDLRREIATLTAAPDTSKAHIRFKDAVGRNFLFPWAVCKTWKGMEGLIKQAFAHVDVLGDHVRAGHYDLTGPDNEHILPQVWESVVQPDWEIQMHMWPMPEIEEKTDELKGDQSQLPDLFSMFGVEAAGRSNDSKPAPRPEKRKKAKRNDGRQDQSEVPVDASKPDLPSSNIPVVSEADDESPGINTSGGTNAEESKKKWYKRWF